MDREVSSWSSSKLNKGFYQQGHINHTPSTYLKKGMVSQENESMEMKFIV